ncbi:putative glycerophosphoryl diester phosphodiesterase, periplasmic protein (glpQ) (modular protein) [Ralstonia solanacearum PSI07]|nr:putative glycerophosphoryl diester phosphodiesterase, periplasmic protein (glpQ) (modular protein) [Ralstonia solanacearum PSI07]
MSLRFALLRTLAVGTAIALSACRLEYNHGGNNGDTTPIATVQVIGHRGAPALRPEHTLASYQKAIDDGADIIEPDLVATQDGVLVARHENEISGTTNVADLSQFAGRRTTKTIDGQSVTGWFTEDFTLAELKTLRARERIPNIRPDNTAYNDQFDIPTLAEIIALARDQSALLGRNIGLYPETKHPTYFQSIGLPLEDRLIAALRQDDFTASRTTVYIQSFEVANLKSIRNKIGSSQPNWKLVQLMGTADQRPYDFTVVKDTRTYGDLMTDQGMRDIATYANGVGPAKSSVIALDANGALTDPSDLIRNAHNVGLVVHPYTFRPENIFLPAALRSGADNARNVSGSIQEIQAFLRAGVDGVFTQRHRAGRQRCADRPQRPHPQRPQRWPRGAPVHLPAREHLPAGGAAQRRGQRAQRERLDPGNPGLPARGRRRRLHRRSGGRPAGRGHLQALAPARHRLHCVPFWENLIHDRTHRRDADRKESAAPAGRLPRRRLRNRRADEHVLQPARHRREGRAAHPADRARGCAPAVRLRHRRRA